MTGQEVVFVWFAYRLDSELLLFSIKSVRETLPGAALVVVEDAQNPLDPAVKKGLTRSPGIHIRTSRWDRNKNLRGKPAICGVLSEMHRACVDHRRVMAFKIDCDTLLLNAQWLRQVEPSVSAIGMYSRAEEYGEAGKEAYWMGFCYGISAQTLQEIGAEAAGREWHPDFPEDGAVGVLVRQKRPVRYIYTRDSGVFVGLRWIDNSEELVLKAARNFDIVTVGSKVAGKDPDKKAMAALALRVLAAKKSHG